MFTFMRSMALALAAFLALASPAAALLIAPPGLLAGAGGSGPAVDHNIDSLSLTLTVSTDDSVAGQTGLTYAVTLNEDPVAAWTVVDFAVIRDWSEGTASDVVNDRGWSGIASDHFVDWSGDAASALGEGESASFGYTVAGGVPSSQLFVYYVTKNGGDAFPVISNESEFISPQVVVPEPTAFALVGGITLLGLWGRRVVKV